MKPDDLVGSVLANRFRLERVLGRGGMGAVYAASDGELGHRVAIKVLRRDAGRIPEAAARFAQEAQIAARLSSPHVVRVHDVGRSQEGDPFIVMELLVGRDLASVIAEPARIDVASAVRLVLEAAAGTAVAHAAGLVHRDLKPANLFLTQQPGGGEVVKVLDFGLSKVTGDVNQSLTQSASAFGTPQYMSPEQVMSAKHVDARCDQHALAMILFELLAKRPPFVAPTAAALTVVIVTAPPPSLRALRADVPRALDAVLARALAKKPAERFADLGAFARALAPFGGAGAAAFAESVARPLGGRSPPAPASFEGRGALSDEVVTLPEAPTMAGVSSGNARARASASFWIAGAALVVAALAATAFAFARRGDDRPAASIAPSEAAATPASASPAIEVRQVATADPEPMTSASASASSSAPPAASVRSPRPRITTRPRPRPAAPRPTHDGQDPTEVFGRGP